MCKKFKMKAVWRLSFALLVFTAIFTESTWAQNWPARPIRFIVSQAAGGTPDLLCRLITERLGRALGQQIFVENRIGGGNVIGAEVAARAAPDGYTFFWATAAALVTNPYTFKSLPYDAIKDFVPVGKVADGPFLLLANPDVAAKTLPELIVLAKSDPGKLTFATDGPRNFSGMIAAWINKLAGTEIEQVPYARMPQGIQDTIAGRVQLTILDSFGGAIHSERFIAAARDQHEATRARIREYSARRRHFSGIRFQRVDGSRSAERRTGQHL